MVAIALDTALQHQKAMQNWQLSAQTLAFNSLLLFDHLAATLKSSRLTLVGTEQPLPLPLVHVFLQTADTLNRMGCTYCRLTYASETIALEALVPTPAGTDFAAPTSTHLGLDGLLFPISCLGGILQTNPGGNQKAVQVLISVPWPKRSVEQRVRVQCRLPILQMALTQLAFLAGLTVCAGLDQAVPLLTDDATQLAIAKRVLWIQQPGQATPKGAKVSLDLSTIAAQLHEAVNAVAHGQDWSSRTATDAQPALSEREVEMMTLLAQGLRDRDIANHLVISESTVKFRINNILTKLKARTCYQARHRVIVNGWIH